MPAPETTRLQVNIKAGDALINLYAETPEQLGAELSALESLATVIAAADQAVKAAYNVAPISSPTAPNPQSAGAQALGTWQAQAQPAPQGGAWGQPAQDQYTQQGPPPAWAGQQQAQSSGQACRHGGMVFKNGVSKTSGKPYSGWFCPSRDRADQCKPVFG